MKSQCILFLNWQHFSVSNYIARGKHILSISTRAEAFSDAFCWGGEASSAFDVFWCQGLCPYWYRPLEKGPDEGSMPCAVSRHTKISANHLLRGICSSERFKWNRLVPLNLITDHCFPAETDSERFVRKQFSREIIVLFIFCTELLKILFDLAILYLNSFFICITWMSHPTDLFLEYCLTFCLKEKRIFSKCCCYRGCTLG